MRLRQFESLTDNEQAERQISSNGVSQSNALLGRVFSDMVT